MDLNKLIYKAGVILHKRNQKKHITYYLGSLCYNKNTKKQRRSKKYTTAVDELVELPEKKR